MVGRRPASGRGLIPGAPLSTSGALRPIVALTAVAMLAGCTAQPPIPSPRPVSTSSPRTVEPPPSAGTGEREPSDSAKDLPQPGVAADWHAAAVLAPDRAAFQRADDLAGVVAAGRTVWHIRSDGSFLPADRLGAVQRFGVIGGPNGYVDWDTPGIVRWSPDGLTWWDDPAGPLDANLSTIVPVDDELLLVGQSTGARAGAWFSAEGRSWAEALGAPLDLWSAVEWPGHGIVAAGGSGPSGVVWSSPDGSVWTDVASPEPGAEKRYLTGLAASPARVVAIGDVDGRAAAWWTTDLIRWTETGAAWGRDAALQSVTWIGDTFLIAGRRSNRPAVWASADGAAWSGVDLPLEDGIAGEAVTVTETHRQPIVFGFTTHDEGNGGWSRTADLIWVLGRWPSG
jgi:hypothetical protein